MAAVRLAMLSFVACFAGGVSACSDAATDVAPQDLWGTWRLTEVRPWGLPVWVDTATYTTEAGVRVRQSLVLDSAWIVFDVLLSGESFFVKGFRTDSVWAGERDVRVSKVDPLLLGGIHVYDPPIVTFPALGGRRPRMLELLEGRLRGNRMVTGGAIRRMEIDSLDPAEFVWERIPGP